MCSQFDLADLGHPDRIFLGSDVHGMGVGILDQTAWQMVEVRPPDAIATP